MYSFLLGIIALVLGYIFYGRFVEKIIAPNADAKTPCVDHPDGIDYIAMPGWKVFMIQFLNIAGTGPIFGAVMGARFGPASYLWIVFGCIFAGAVHDYISGMSSLRYNGTSLPEVIGLYMGQGFKKVIMVFILLLLVMVGAVFVYSPAIILGDIAGDGSMKAVLIWAGVVFAYYLIATLLPIDKIIGKLYPIFAFALIFMAVSLFVCLLVKWPTLPEVWDGLQNRAPETGLEGQNLFPCLFITIACGAISGFHATQSPLMARCMVNETMGRKIFYGSMITEGIIALIWAAVSSFIFFDGGLAEIGATSTAAPALVTAISKHWLGAFGGVLALLGVVAAPITTGDTALRSARMIVADFIKLDQKPIRNRLLISIPLFILTGLLLWFNVADENGFNSIWRYFGWTNQTLSVFTLWAMTVFLSTRRKKCYYLVTLIPACFMTAICLSFIMTEKIGFGLPGSWAPWIALIVFVLSAVCFYIWFAKKGSKKQVALD